MGSSSAPTAASKKWPVGACAPQVLRRAVECAAAGQRDPGVDPPALRHRGPGARVVGRGAAGAAAAGGGADPRPDRGEAG